MSIPAHCGVILHEDSTSGVNPRLLQRSRHGTGSSWGSDSRSAPAFCSAEVQLRRSTGKDALADVRNFTEGPNWRGVVAEALKLHSGNSHCSLTHVLMNNGLSSVATVLGTYPDERRSTLRLPG
jgi:hypothetical protein